MRHVYYQAAGGVVVHDGKVLLLDRPSRGEVREEAGYANLEVVADLGTQQIQFLDPFRERQVTRDERYFLMRLRDKGRPEREKTDRQFISIWVPAAAAVTRLTFEAEREFVRRALRWIQENGL